jgi:hypothetical protein
VNQSPELTPKEQFHASLYRDPRRLFRRALIRALSFIIPSMALMAIWYFTRDPAYALFGYGILLYQAIYRLALTKRGVETTGSLFESMSRSEKRRRAASMNMLLSLL